MALTFMGKRGSYVRASCRFIPVKHNPCSDACQRDDLLLRMRGVPSRRNIRMIPPWRSARTYLNVLKTVNMKARLSNNNVAAHAKRPSSFRGLAGRQPRPAGSAKNTAVWMVLRWTPALRSSGGPRTSKGILVRPYSWGCSVVSTICGDAEWSRNSQPTYASGGCSVRTSRLSPDIWLLKRTSSRS